MGVGDRSQTGKTIVLGLATVDLLPVVLDSSLSLLEFLAKKVTGNYLTAVCGME